ncbi:uncharacterized protein PRCAT00001982001 [Priceomyces carsonii]|uniref:uncharacterized protein n=1 Tax=Priceomyces carsonii TaxID=28549 RepID=UPI002ED8346D|nr:unnamed protein product [Priceomyces carsonii]
MEHRYTYEDNARRHSSGKRIGSLTKKVHESLISIETSDEENSDNLKNELYPIIHDQESIYDNDNRFQRELDKIKSKSSERFMKKWESILNKYSSINDEKDSDEIDLSTGKIVKDNGHLRSLKNEASLLSEVAIDSNIWSVTYDVDRESAARRKRESRNRQRKRELKSKLKQDDLFHNNGLISEIATSFQSTECEGHQSDSLADNLLLLTPSPAKRSRVSPSKYSSPLKDRRSETPSRVLLREDASSPIKRKLEDLISQTCPNFLTSYNQYLDDQVEDLKDGFYEDKKTNLEGFFRKNENWPSSRRNQSQDASYQGSIIARDLEKSDDTEALDYRDQDSMSDTEDSGNESNDFSDQFLIVSDVYHEHIPSTGGMSIFECAFDDCYYSTGNKSLYRKHLIESHREILSKIGYPTATPDGTQKCESVLSSAVTKLTQIFPLHHDIPELPKSADCQPLICQLGINGKPCKKVFLNEESLFEHQKEYPLRCSCKDQVFVCPVLGCGFMTDEGYLEWRMHFIKEGRHNESMAPLVSNLSELSELFSDSGKSDSEFSEINVQSALTQIHRGSNLCNTSSEEYTSVQNFESDKNEKNCERRKSDNTYDSKNDVLTNIGEDKHIESISHDALVKAPRHLSVSIPKFLDAAVDIPPMITLDEDKDYDSLDELFDSCD